MHKHEQLIFGFWKGRKEHNKLGEMPYAEIGQPSGTPLHSRKRTIASMPVRAKSIAGEYCWGEEDDVDDEAD